MTILADNPINKPIKKVIRKLGLYGFVYNLLSKFGMHDDISMRFIKKLIGKDNPIILEIGSNTGEDTQRFLKAFKNPKIYSFEPDPRAIKLFKENICSPNSELITFAISNKNSYITLHQSSGRIEYVAGKEVIEDWTASSTIKKPQKTLSLSLIHI